ncbi:GNAT family N-acetyltransferase [Candidatus Nitrotoga sp. 1052]|uniref:GNAT family N-acetyltransferase n=1 Tax=Candidatus Nitrotoga sp. 1052 TaxID=2886964 RepID=UPI001EF4481A|nr:GNAT family N-acetyltransferase [Candidatus Nitrotoga sp. 1052]CAH1073972.1 GNAT family N-acetyltransferase [Candidatus Nitrotoga sp. 1052]
MFSVHLLSWHNGQPLLRVVREAVFMGEQGVSAEMEWDGLDDACHHALALSATGDAIGCGRISPEGHIGRIAVLPAWRGKRVGSLLLESLLDYARSQHYAQVELGAQIQAVLFYRRFNFTEVGEIFMDANMPHIKMQLRLKNC